MLVTQQYPQRVLKDLKKRASRFLSLIKPFNDTLVHSDPTTLIDLLSQAALKHPRKAVKIYDNGLDAEPFILTYPDLLHRAQVSPPDISRGRQH